MASYETIGAIVFLVFLTLYFALSKKSLDIKSYKNYGFLAMRRTKLGLKLMDSLSKYKRIVKLYGYLGVILGFLGMLMMVAFFGHSVYLIFKEPASPPPVGFVVPFETDTPGVLGIPFSYWIISIFIIALVHEFSHGVVARAFNIKVKSSGFMFIGIGLRIAGYVIALFSLLSKRLEYMNLHSLTIDFLNYATPEFWLFVGILLVIISYFHDFWIPIIPAAFVEPDEKDLKKRPLMEQLSVYAAGPMANFVLVGILMLGSMFVVDPFVEKLAVKDGVIITDYAVENINGVNVTYPIERAGINKGERIIGIDGKLILSHEELTQALKNKKPDDKITLNTNVSTYKIQLAKNPKDENMGYMGVYLQQSIKLENSVKERYGDILPAISWFVGLYGMLIFLNLGIGIFNLLPAGPLDGGRMLYSTLLKKFNKEKAAGIFAKISIVLGIVVLFFMAIIMKNIFFHFF